ncbi:MAG: DUF6457 domain-containing protein [Actinomycetes bacterium]
MSTMDDWTRQVVDHLGIADAVQRDEATRLVLDVARDVAHGVARPAAPVTAFLLGLAAARADDPVAALPDLARQVTDLVPPSED